VRPGHQQKASDASSFYLSEASTPKKKKLLSQHDLFNKYFRRDTVVLRNLDLLRYAFPLFSKKAASPHAVPQNSANDATLVLVLTYSLVISFLPRVSDGTALGLHFAHALAWCLFHCFGLGLLLRAQGQNKFLVRHFMKNYHYPANDGGGAIVEAFANWKAIYNLSLVMSYGLSFFPRPRPFENPELIGKVVSFIGVVWKTYSIPNDWTVGHELLRHTMGAVRSAPSSFATRC
jgi:phosphatidylethanolamine N-methyltransferase